jgi:membrane-bound lytic murein transglycosylase
MFKKYVIVSLLIASALSAMDKKTKSESTGGKNPSAHNNSANVSGSIMRKFERFTEISLKSSNSAYCKYFQCEAEGSEGSDKHSLFRVETPCDGCCEVPQENHFKEHSNPESLPCHVTQLRAAIVQVRAASIDLGYDYYGAKWKKIGSVLLLVEGTKKDLKQMNAKEIDEFNKSRMAF